MSVGTSMETLVQFHGVWCAGDRVSEKLLKSVIADYSSKPFRSCKFFLSTSGLSLELLPTEDGRKGGKLNDIDFKDIKDIIYGQQNAPWLLVIYLDSKRTLSIIACSCQTPEDVLSIHKAYLSIKYSKQQNWQFRLAQQQHGVVNGGAVPNQALRAQLAQRSSLTSARHGSSYTSYNDSEVGNGHSINNRDSFLIRQNEFTVGREHIEVNSDGHPTARHIGVQTLSTDKDHDTASIASECSAQNVRDDIQSLSEEMKDIKLSEQLTGISAEEYHRQGDLSHTKNRKTVAFHPTPAVINNHNSLTQDSHRVQETNRKTHGPDDYDRRSVGAQTERNRRYAKNPLTPTISSANKDRVAAMRRRGGSESGSTLTFEGQMSNIGDTSSPMGNAGVRPYSGKPLMRSLSTGRTTVVRPIEQVYHTRTGSQKKRTIVVTSKPLYM
ncbi:hypothetical protein Btru_075679 [Bulinus truncatus]|nr:hypothetical protein Btru_075679 [Bulinus truncatus]